MYCDDYHAGRAVARSTCTRGGYLRFLARRVPSTTWTARSAPTAVAGTACAVAVGAPVAAMTTVATSGATISTAESAVAGLISLG
eukprot:COSAG01_NODE_1555_length_9928_cov_20.399837_5_plen_85_part_00